VSQLKQRARELGVEIPSNVEKGELVSILDEAERRHKPQCPGASSSGGCRTRTVSELKSALVEMGIEVPPYIVEKADLLRFVEEAERQLSRKRTTLNPAKDRPRPPPPTSPQPKVRFRNATGQIPPPWYQKESRSKPGNFYYVNAETGETAWELPQAAPPPPPKPPGAPSPSSGTGAAAAPPRPASQQAAPATAADTTGATASSGSTSVPPIAGFSEAGEDGEGADGGGKQAANRTDDSARHDYRDDGFSDEGGSALAPLSERRWSRHGTMSCRRDDSGGVKALALAQVLPPSAAEWDPDTTIAPTGLVKGARFTWVRGQMIGRGSLGRVFKALDQLTGQILAVKEVPCDMKSEADHKFIEDLRNEVSIMQGLEHPNIVRYLGHDFMDTSFYMYLEHMPGGSLTQALQQFGAFDEELLAQYSRQILDGLEYLHTRNPPVVHRDIKGPNILVGADCKVKLADFGCAKRTQETMTHTMRGSMHWMAPEVIAHERYGRAADIWSFGCVAIEMGTAKVPWGKLDNPMAAVIKIGMSEETPPLPEELSAVGENFISICVQRDASLRPSATELLNHEFVRDVVLG